MFIFKDLYKYVYNNEIDADELIIITGYVGPSVIEGLKDLKYKCSIFVGMYGGNMDPILHRSLMTMPSDNVSIFYTTIMVHSKCYIWRKNSKVVKAFTGSANFSMNGIYSDLKESLGEVKQEDFEDLNNYTYIVDDNSININAFTPTRSSTILLHSTTPVIADQVRLSLLSTRSGSSNLLGVKTIKGEVPTCSGINWGFSNALPKPNDAYIPISKVSIESHPGFVKSKGSVNVPIDAIWDDGMTMKMLFEGNQIISGNYYPKQLSSFNDKSRLGVYIRQRIGEKIGENLILPDISKNLFKQVVREHSYKLITKEHLDRYGRNFVEIKKLQENVYYLDFSV